jgi:hypothetical protein
MRLVKLMMAAGNETLMEEEVTCYVEIGFGGRHVISDPL